jgi:hypothetical protein
MAGSVATGGGAIPAGARWIAGSCAPSMWQSGRGARPIRSGAAAVIRATSASCVKTTPTGNAMPTARDSDSRFGVIARSEATKQSRVTAPLPTPLCSSGGSPRGQGAERSLRGYGS